MEDENCQLLENAHSEFNKRNFDKADELYARLISSCLQSRYYFAFQDMSNKLTADKDISRFTCQI